MTQDIEKACRADLLAIAGAYSAARGLSLATVSGQLHGNQAFLANFKTAKSSITLAKLREMVAEFSARWPDGTAWPKVQILERPVPRKAEKRGQKSVSQ